MVLEINNNNNVNRVSDSDSDDNDDNIENNAETFLTRPMNPWIKPGYFLRVVVITSWR